MSHTTKHKMAALLVLLLQLGTAQDLETPSTTTTTTTTITKTTTTTPSLADVVSSAGLTHNSHC